MNAVQAIRAMALAALLAAAAVPAAGADGTAAPFRDAPAAVARATALELIGLRARAAVAVGRMTAEIAEDTQAMRSHDLPLVQARLGRADAGTAAGLAASVDAFLRAVDTGRPLEGPAADLRAAIDEAAAALELSTVPARDGAVASLLLVSEVGLAEAYEEAAEGDTEAYPRGWASLQRVKAILAGFRPGMSAELAAEAETLLGRLDALFAAADPPARFDADPEAAEALAHGLVGVLERAAGADLYFGRSLADGLSGVRALAADGCAESDPALTRETVAIARFYHAHALADPLSVLAPAAQRAARSAYADVLDADRRGAAACQELLAALDRARAHLFPGAGK